MIELLNVDKKINQSVILNNISLNITKGSIFGLIGPNGAGKTSLLKIMAGIWEADTGVVTAKGMKVFDNPEIKKCVAFIPDFSHYYPSFKVSEMIRFYKLAYSSFEQIRFTELNEMFKIPVSKKISALSKGMKTALSFILNLSIMPEILIMDEPTSGLDPIAKRKFVEIILDEVAQRETTVIISTHNLQDIEQICDTVAVIHKGEVLSCAPIEEIKNGYKKIQAVLMEPKAEVLNSPDILYSSNIVNIYTFILKSNSSEFEDVLKKEGASDIKEENLSLEEIFIYSLGGENNVIQNAE